MCTCGYIHLGKCYEQAFYNEAGSLNPSSEKSWKTKDSGERQQFSTGMQRDIQTNKPRYDLVDWPMIKRWAELMQRGALKYGEHNWKKAETETEFERFRSSALRHMVQWFNGESDEDHAAACYFNIAGAEMVRAKMLQKDKKC